MNRMSILRVSICLCLLLVGVSAQDGRDTARKEVKPATIPGEWELKPLAVEGSPAPGGGQFHFLPYPYLEYPIWVQSGITAFWSSSDPKDKGSTLYSIKDSKVRRILTEGESLSIVGTDKAKVERSYKSPPMKATVTGKALLYINALQSSLTAKSAVYTWDGEQLRLLLGNDSKLEVAGETYKVYRAYASQTAADGKVVIICESDKPKWVAFSLNHDGVNLTPLTAYVVKEKKSLLLAVGGVRGSAADSQSDSKENKPLPLAVGDPDPFDPTKKILSLSLIGSANKNSVAFILNSSKTPEPVLAIYQSGKFHRLFDRNLPGVKEKAPWRVYNIESGFFLDWEAPGYFFKVTLHRKSELKSYNYELVPHYFFFDGENVHHLWESAESTQSTMPVLLSSLGKGAFEANGVLLRGVGAKGYRVFDGVTVFDVADLGSAWLLEVSGKEFSFKPAPEFNVKERKVSLGNVVGWKSPTEAIVRLGDGIYLLSRARQ